MKRAYELTLKNGETRTIYFLEKPVYRCRISGDGSDHFKTMEQIKSDSRIEEYDKEDPMRFVQKNIGYIRDEQTIFDVYKGLKNPIIKLELKEIK